MFTRYLTQQTFLLLVPNDIVVLLLDIHHFPSANGYCVPIPDAHIYHRVAGIEYTQYNGNNL